MHEELIRGKVKKVGNSIAIFVSAEYSKRYQLVPGVEIEFPLKKRKAGKGLSSIFGMAKGGKYEAFTDEDRIDWHG